MGPRDRRARIGHRDSSIEPAAKGDAEVRNFASWVSRAAKVADMEAKAKPYEGSMVRSVRAIPTGFETNRRKH